MRAQVPGECHAFNKIALFTAFRSAPVLRKEDSEPDAPDGLANEELELSWKVWQRQVETERGHFSAWRDAVLHNERTHANSQHGWDKANEDHLHECTLEIMAKCYGIQEAVSIAAGNSGAAAALTSSQDYHAGSMGGNARCWKLHVINGSYVGAMPEEIALQLPAHISNVVASDPVHAAVVYLPPTSLRGSSLVRHPTMEAFRRMEED